MDKRVWTVGLRNDETTEQNIGIALEHAIWGMKNAGIHKEIKTGDTVVFLIGVSIHNIEEMRENDVYSDPDNIFPNYKNELLTPNFVNLFEFQVDSILYGTITSDFFIDQTEVWPPRIDTRVDKKTGEELVKKNYFANRFKWTLTHQGQDKLLTVEESNFDFHANIIKALRSKRVEPCHIHSERLATLLSMLTEVQEELIDEEAYQGAIETAPTTIIPGGPIKAPQKAENSGASGKWPRKAGIAKNALESASFKCERDAEHKTFISRVTNENFVEAHHLVPMERQNDFDVSLDVPENILSLCPNCHSMFHHSHHADIIPLVSQFFDERKSALKERGIHIELEKLVGYYVKGQ